METKGKKIVCYCFCFWFQWAHWLRQNRKSVNCIVGCAQKPASSAEIPVSKWRTFRELFLMFLTLPSHDRLPCAEIRWQQNKTGFGRRFWGLNRPFVGCTAGLWARSHALKLNRMVISDATDFNSERLCFVRRIPTVSKQTRYRFTLHSGHTLKQNKPAQQIRLRTLCLSPDPNCVGCELAPHLLRVQRIVLVTWSAEFACGRVEQVSIVWGEFHA